jgi:hypothetical protein
MFKVTIRELLLLTLVVAVTLGWWLDRRGLAKAVVRHKAREEFFALILAERGMEVRRSDEGVEVLNNGSVGQQLP